MQTPDAGAEQPNVPPSNEESPRQPEPAAPEVHDVEVIGSEHEEGGAARRRPKAASGIGSMRGPKTPEEWREIARRAAQRDLATEERPRVGDLERTVPGDDDIAKGKRSAYRVTNRAWQDEFIRYITDPNYTQADVAKALKVPVWSVYERAQLEGWTAKRDEVNRRIVEETSAAILRQRERFVGGTFDHVLLRLKGLLDAQVDAMESEASAKDRMTITEDNAGETRAGEEVGAANGHGSGSGEGLENSPAIIERTSKSDFKRERVLVNPKSFEATTRALATMLLGFQKIQADVAIATARQQDAPQRLEDPGGEVSIE